MPDPKTTLEQLARLAGSWRTTGRMRLGASAGLSFAGSDRYHWLPGGVFLQHGWKVRMPDGLHQGLEILGFDPAARGTFAHAYDADGSVTLSTLRFRGDALHIAGPQLVFKGRFDGDGSMLSGTWSTTADGTPVMDVTLRRVAAAAGRPATEQRPGV